MSENPSIDVSVVLPVYNERGHVGQEIDRIRAALDASPFSYEIIVVDDGSTDGTSDAVRDCKGIRLIQFEQNRGSGSSRRVGTQAAEGEVVVWTDADMSYPNERIPELVAELDGWDQVVGARTTEEGTRKVLRVPAKWIIRNLASYLTETKIPDLNSGMRVFRRSVSLQFLHLLPKGFSCVTTLTMSFLSNGYSVKYVPIEYAKRAGESKFHWWTDTRKYLLQVVRMMLLYNPLRVFMPLALTLLAVGSGKLAYDLIGSDFRVAGNTLLLFSAAFLLVLVALLADLIVQLNRPKNAVDPASVYSSDSRIPPRATDPGP
jgi:glycosyltransferase involved in cell wall biosynthesis